MSEELVNAIPLLGTLYWVTLSLSFLGFCAFFTARSLNAVPTQFLGRPFTSAKRLAFVLSALICAFGASALISMRPNLPFNTLVFFLGFATGAWAAYTMSPRIFGGGAS